MATWREQRNARRSISHDMRFTDIHPQQKADMPGDKAGGHSLFVKAGPHEARLAEHGYDWATHNSNHPIPFSASNGEHKVGGDVIGIFSRSVNFAGGVRQGHTFVSDPASGVARATVEGHNTPSSLGAQGQGSGHTFEQRQHQRWAGNGGG